MVARRNAMGFKCEVCGRVFAAGKVPNPEVGGRYDGARLCRDCRDEYEREVAAMPTTPPLF